MIYLKNDEKYVAVRKECVASVEVIPSREYLETSELYHLVFKKGEDMGIFSFITRRKDIATEDYFKTMCGEIHPRSSINRQLLEENDWLIESNGILYVKYRVIINMVNGLKYTVYFNTRDEAYKFADEVRLKTTLDHGFVEFKLSTKGF